MTAATTRVLSGVPAGGQFAATARCEAGVHLASEDPAEIEQARRGMLAANAHLGRTEASLVVATRRTGLAARLHRGEVARISSAILTAKGQAGAARVELAEQLGLSTTTPIAEEARTHRVEAFRAAVGALPDPGHAANDLEAATAAMEHLRHAAHPMARTTAAREALELGRVRMEVARLLHEAVTTRT